MSGLTLGAGDNQGDRAIYVDGPCPRGAHSLVGKINIEIIVWDQQTEHNAVSEKPRKLWKSRGGQLP